MRSALLLGLGVSAAVTPLSLTVIVPATEPVDYGCCGLGPPWIGTFVTVPLRPF